MLDRKENCRNNFESERWRTENKDKYRTFMPENSKTEETKIEENQDLQDLDNGESFVDGAINETELNEPKQKKQVKIF